MPTDPSPSAGCASWQSRAVPAWPVEHGGTNWTLRQHYVFQRELALVQAPPVTPNATGMLGPVVIAFGTEAQQAEILPGIRCGDTWWAQGYSEPEAGSDLARLQCRAVRDGDDYVIRGTKIWTTHAQFSDHMFCLVRTDSSGKPQQGISFLMFDLDRPGISIEPIISISGDHEINQVFFDDVRVPVTALLGAEHDGWTIAKYLLEHERGGSSAPRLQVRLNRIASWVNQSGLSFETGLRERMAAAAIALDALEAVELEVLSRAESGGTVGFMSSALKIRATEAQQRITELGIGAAALYGLPLQPEVRAAWELPREAVGPRDLLPLMPQYLNGRAASIYAGSNEIVRNIIAKAVLGL